MDQSPAPVLAFIHWKTPSHILTQVHLSTRRHHFSLPQGVCLPKGWHLTSHRVCICLLEDAISCTHISFMPSHTIAYPSRYLIHSHILHVISYTHTSFMPSHTLTYLHTGIVSVSLTGCIVHSTLCLLTFYPISNSYLVLATQIIMALTCVQTWANAHLNCTAMLHNSGATHTLHIRNC